MSSGTTSLLDAVMPQWDFDELHEASLSVPPRVAMAAVRDVSGREIRLVGPLMALRLVPSFVRHPRATGGRMLGTIRGRGSRPVIEDLLDTGFVELAAREGEELVWGVVGRFWRPTGNLPIPIEGRDEFMAFEEPGYAKAAMNFVVVAEGEGARVTTETRILATSPDARRSFGRYWRLIHPGSALIRRSWLAAIRRRAERSGSGADG